jgi:hypothetical protein
MDDRQGFFFNQSTQKLRASSPGRFLVFIAATYSAIIGWTALAHRASSSFDSSSTVPRAQKILRGRLPWPDLQSLIHRYMLTNGFRPTNRPVAAT